MSYTNDTYMTPTGLMYKGVLSDISKSKESLRPFFEAFTNCWEAIQIKRTEGVEFNPKIEIKVYSTETTDSSYEFTKLSIRDNGIGFNDKEFERFNNYKDITKGFKNLGSGRIQYVHHFVKTNVNSIYKTDDGLRKRQFVLSKVDEFLAQNAIVFHKSDEPLTEEEETGTLVVFSNLWDERSMKYHNLTDKILKENILSKYMQLFCLNSSHVPAIIIEHYVHNELISTSEINHGDIPELDKTESIRINYSSLSSGGTRIRKTDNSEEFTINAFKFDKSRLKENRIKLTSKNEVVEDADFDSGLLSKTDVIEGNRFLILIASDYIDARDTDVRGQIRIPRREDFQKTIDLFGSEEIIIEDIESEVNSTVVGMYPEIQSVKEDHEMNLQRLKEMFLLPNQHEYGITISVNDSEKQILEKFYKSEAKKSADLDANIKEQVDRLNLLDPTSDDYEDQLQSEIEQLVKIIPMQNKLDLTHYVARRKLVLDLFAQILDRRLSVQNDGSRQNNEALLHNLIFQQSQSDPNKSDLWLMNEDFIYFNGNSEQRLTDLKIDGNTILKDSLTPEETAFRTSLNQDRLTKRPDILLFPEESKCIIIEFKSPDVSVSAHLNQIQNYATLLLLYTKEEYRFETFYGYLIGESIDPLDVRAHDSDFVEAYNLDYLYRPSKKVADLLGTRRDGSIYMEVIKYSTLLERAKIRNDIFIKKLTTIPLPELDELLEAEEETVEE
ncbi:MAG: hypothetical protein JKX84_04605 [Flavobacteriales bacterium]|nr:hypothetical protein [Flavobacteriales bacterium]